jgi:hypothetical protein
MIATATMAVGLAGGRWYLGQTPQVLECRWRARIHAGLARNWAEYAKLSEEGRAGITNLVPGQGTLEFYDAYPLQWPASPEAAAEFDRRCAEVAAICRDRAEYHVRMRQKWLRGADRPWESVAPDPPPSFPIEASSVRDVSL